MKEDKNNIEYKASYYLSEFNSEDQIQLVDYICKLCNGVSCEPFMDICGHIFCYKCIYYYLGNHQKCPLSQTPHKTSDIFQVKFITNFLGKKFIHCKNINEGCDWHNELWLRAAHLKDDCLKEKIKCSFEECPVIDFRENLDQHTLKCEYRLIKCIECDMTLTYKKVNVHQDTCPNRETECINKCGKIMKRNLIEYHCLNECEEHVNDCPFNGFGCKSRFKRKEFKIHSISEEHNFSILEYIEKLNNECIRMIGRLNEGCNSIITNLENQNNSIDYLIKYENIYSKKLSENKEKNIKDLPHNQSDLQDEILKLLSSSESVTTEDSKDSNENIVRYEFDKKNSSQGFLFVDKYTAWSIVNNEQKSYKFLFSNLILNAGDKEYRWKFIFKKCKNWCGFGLCERELIIKNNLKYNFLKPQKENSGIFMITSIGTVIHSNSLSENNTSLKNFSKLESNFEIEIIYFSGSKKASFIVENVEHNLINVFPKNTNNSLVPFVVLMKNGEEVKIQMEKTLS